MSTHALLKPDIPSHSVSTADMSVTPARKEGSLSSSPSSWPKCGGAGQIPAPLWGAAKCGVGLDVCHKPADTEVPML